MDTPISTALLEEVKAAFERLENLPFPVHVSDFQGNFLFANHAAFKLFRLRDQESMRSFNIIASFEDPGERIHLIRQVQKVSSGQWVENLTARLHIDDEHYKIRFASMPFFENRQLVAMLNIADSMSIIEWFAEFENELDLGLFEIDKDFIIIDCNHALVAMMGFSNVKEIKGKPVSNFLWSQTDIQSLIQEIKLNKFLKNRRVKLRRLDDAMVIVQMSCKAIFWEEGQIARIKGIIRDITFEIIQQVNPLGLFMVTERPNGDDIFSRVNDTFAHIHGYESADGILGLPADTFQPKLNDNYLTELNNANKNHEPLLDHYMDIVDRHGITHNVVVNVSYVFGEAEKIRVGAIYDLTNHVGKHQRTLEKNFSAILHTYIATIDGLRSTLQMLVKAHGQDLLKADTKLDRRKAVSEIERHKIRFSRLLEQLLIIAKEKKINEDQLNKIQKYWRNLSTTHESEKSNASWVRLNSIEISRNLNGLKALNFPIKLFKRSCKEIKEVLRLSSIISISISIDELNERIHDFYYFRDYLRRGNIEGQDRKPVNLISIISNSIQFLEELASLNGVIIKQMFNPKDIIVVLCTESVLGRAIHSLFHNAIKYSWSKNLEQRSIVEIKVERKESLVEVTIENWGVPIRKEELENDFIFQFGKRGKESDDRGRAGTGIGLFDARDIILRHNGTLKITSEPTFGNLSEVYTNPFITRAYITLPILEP